MIALSTVNTVVRRSSSHQRWHISELVSSIDHSRFHPLGNCQTCYDAHTLSCLLSSTKSLPSCSSLYNIPLHFCTCNDRWHEHLPDLSNVNMVLHLAVDIIPLNCSICIYPMPHLQHNCMRPIHIISNICRSDPCPWSGEYFANISNISRWYDCGITGMWMFTFLFWSLVLGLGSILSRWMCP